MSSYLPSHEPTTPPRFAVPDEACDCHFHIFDAFRQFPLAPSRSFVPTVAPLARWDRVATTLGVRRGVLVQASPYGVDNRLLLDALARRPATLRGVAAPDPASTDAELQQMDQLGVRGIRVNVYRGRDGAAFPGGLNMADAARLMPRAAALGWHLELFVNVARDLVELEPALSKLPPVPLVFAHMGCLDDPKQLNSDGFRLLLEMVADGRAHVKLSGVDRLCPNPSTYARARPLLIDLLHANRDRLLWGSNWPHPHVAEFMADDGHLFQLLADWVDDPVALRAILVDNPAHLYGFSQSGPTL